MAHLSRLGASCRRLWRAGSRIAELPATLGFHQLWQYWLDRTVNRLIDHVGHSRKIGKLDQDRHRGWQHADTSRALGGQRLAGSRPIGMISLPGNVGRLLIIRHSRHKERRVIAARLDFRSNPVRPRMEICLGEYHTSLFRRLTKRAAADRIALAGCVYGINATTRKNHHGWRE